MLTDIRKKAFFPVVRRNGCASNVGTTMSTAKTDPLLRLCRTIPK